MNEMIIHYCRTDLDPNRIYCGRAAALGVVHSGKLNKVDCVHCLDEIERERREAAELARYKRKTKP